MTVEPAATTPTAGCRRPPHNEGLGVAPGRGQLLDRLNQVIDFAARQLSSLDPSQEPWSEEIGPLVTLADKIATEAALLLLLVSRLPEDLREGLERCLLGIRADLDRLARSDRMRLAVARFPWAVHPLGIGHMVLTLLGDSDEACERLVRAAWEAGQTDAAERPRFREMDVRWVRGLSPESKPTEMDDLLDGAMLLSPLHPIYATRSDAYAFTHEAMYLSDFGLREIPPAADRGELRTAIEAALAWQIAAEDMDLMVEYLICACLCDMPWSAYCDLAWKCVDYCWQELGFLPSPTFEASEFLKLTSNARTAYAWRHVYHTTFVAGMLYAILLAQPSRPAAMDEHKEVTKVLGRSWVDLAEGYRPGTPALWKKVAPALAEDPTDSRRDVLLDAFLIHAAREYDLGWLSAGLAVALRDRRVSPTAMTAAEFLARQQLLSMRGGS